MTRVRVRGIPTTPAKVDIPGGIQELEPMPTGNAIGDGVIWDGTDWVLNNDPPAFAVSLFGTDKFVGFSRRDIQGSNDNKPKYIWRTTTQIQSFSIGPDAAIYTGGTGGVYRFPLSPLNTNGINGYQIATAAVPSANAVCFFAGQAPAMGLDAWTFFFKKDGGGIYRFDADGIRSSTQPAWVTPDEFGTIAIRDAALDSAGRVWLQDGNTQINRYTNLNGAPGAGVADVSIGGGNWPASRQGIAISSGGNLYTARFVNNSVNDIRMLDAAGIAAIVGLGLQNPVPTAIITCPDLVGCEYIVFDYLGNLWATGFNSCKVVMLRASDLLTSGSKSAAIVLTGGGELGDGVNIGPTCIRFFPGFGPVR